MKPAVILVLFCSVWMWGGSAQEGIAFRVIAADKNGAVAIQPMLPVQFGAIQVEGEPLEPHAALDCNAQDRVQGKLGADTVSLIELHCGKRKLLVQGVTFNAQ